MRQDTVILIIVGVIVVSSIVAIVQHMRYSASEYDYFGPGGGSEFVMAQYSCGDATDSVRTRNVFDFGKSLAVAAGAANNNDRRDLLAWRTKRNGQMKRRPRATDAAPFDALRPAYDAMCQAVERQQAECYRPIGPESGNNNNNKKSDGADNNAAAAAAAALDDKQQPKWARALRRQMHLWSPPKSAFLQRPTLLCVTMVDDITESRVERALLQWKLWGHHCDDFYVALQLPTADQTVVHNGTTDRLRLRGRFFHMFRRYGLPITHLWAVRPLVSWKIADVVRADRWQAFRELSRVMGDEELNTPVYQAEYTLFVRDDTYVVPENVFGFLSSPEVRHLDNLGAPVLLGHVLQVPPPSPEEVAEAAAAGGEAMMGAEQREFHDGEQQPAPKFNDHDHDHDDHHDKNGGGAHHDEPRIERRLFASLDGGLIWNRVTRKLFMNAIRSQDACAFSNTEADDVVLADCFRYYGINPIDTADTRGSDRQHILPPEWAMKVGHDPHAIEWYSLFRGRPSLKGAAAISPTSMTFGGLKSSEEMQQLHDLLSEH